jgi:hypothetical protein
MKVIIIIFLTITAIGSCESQNSNINLSPTLKLIDGNRFEFERQIIKYSLLDSVLTEYLETIPSDLRDSITVNLEVNTYEVTIQRVSDTKVSLRKNKLLKINYKPIK